MLYVLRRFLSEFATHAHRNPDKFRRRALLSLFISSLGLLFPWSLS